jgi:hypothetical protein
MERCRHERSWFIAGGWYEWCWECGALRKLRPSGVNCSDVVSQWTRPIGKGGKNPLGKGGKNLFPMKMKKEGKVER